MKAKNDIWLKTFWFGRFTTADIKHNPWSIWNTLKNLDTTDYMRTYAPVYYEGKLFLAVDLTGAAYFFLLKTDKSYKQAVGTHIFWFLIYPFL